MPSKKDEDSKFPIPTNPFHGLDKSKVLQEAKTFNENSINTRKCTQILAKILYLMNQGITLGETEATDTFFAMTKLFQSKEVTLRRMCYLAIKELCPLVQHSLIVVSSLTKDITEKEDSYRASAVRALCKVVDSSMMPSIERYIKQLMVDNNAAISSAALVSSLNFIHTNIDMVRRWQSEIQQGVEHPDTMVSYHALGLIYYIKKNDRLALSKLIGNSLRNQVSSPYAMCLMIRIISKYMDDDPESPEYSKMYKVLDSKLNAASEIVRYEAARAIVNLKNLKSRDLSAAVSVLQMYLGSSKSYLRFAAIKTLSKVSMIQPMAVVPVNLDLETLVSDSNRCIATLAITTLLKTGTEASVDRLMKQISTFMGDISDDFKIVVIDAVRSLCLKFPRKHMMLLTFLSGMLRDEGGLEFKKAVVEAIVGVIEENKDARDSGLAHLGDFIEDCEHSVIAVRVLHFLGVQGPQASRPASLIRFIVNRVILESPEVRAAAVDSLAKFGAACESLRPSILALLSRCMMDSDDEVRDRATLYYHLLMKAGRPAITKYILDGLNISYPALEKALLNYLSGSKEKPFDIKTVPIAAPVPEQKPNVTRDVTTVKVVKQEDSSVKLLTMPQFSSLGPLFKSSKPVPLTEAETEYVVHCTKHVFLNHVVLQFDCLNTVSTQLLENVSVQLLPPAGYTLVTEVPCTQLKYNIQGQAYACVKLPSDPTLVTGTFSCTLKFSVSDCDPTTGEPDGTHYNDVYQLEDFELLMSDHIVPVKKMNFSAAWEDLGESHQIEDTFGLSSVTTLQDGVSRVVEVLGMQPAEMSDRVPADKATHSLLLSGVYRGNKSVLVLVRFALKDGVSMHLCLRCEDPVVNEVIMSAVVG